jgi:branched-chain amino acid transport system permease protein
VKILGVHYPLYRLAVAMTSVAAIAGLWLFLSKTRYGLWLRAVRQDGKMATALGIPVGRVYMLAVGLGGLLAGLGGVLAAPIVVVQYQMGFDILATVFIVVVIGGFGSLFGAAATAVLLGMMEGLITVVATPTWARIASLAVMGAMLLARPDGIFRRRAIAR